MLHTRRSARHEGLKAKRKRLILIVDDSPEDRSAYRRLLLRGANGFSVAEAGTGAVGLERCRERTPDCLLLDYRLPDLDGLEFLSEITNSHDTPPLPVIMITGQGDEAVAVEAMKRGARDYLVKEDITATALKRAVSSAMEMAAREREHERYLEHLERISTIDELTGAHNRHFLFRRLAEEIARARRYRLPLCVLMFDLDNFKHINDRHGHLRADRVLESFGRLLRAEARSTDIVARYGGDEFCVVLTNTGRDGGLQLAERICKQAGRRRHAGKKSQSFKVTCSAGVAEWKPRYRVAAALLEAADKALYGAKQQGGNQARHGT